LPLALRAVAFVAYAAFTLWTVRRLLRPAADPGSRMVRRYGVLGWGFGFWLLMTADFARRSTFTGTEFWTHALTDAFILLPISLWGGYLWGRAMGSFFGWFFGDRL